MEKKQTIYRIENVEMGSLLGDYEADSPEDALEQLAEDEGYASWLEMVSEESVKDGEISVTLLDPRLSVEKKVYRQEWKKMYGPDGTRQPCMPGMIKG